MKYKKYLLMFFILLSSIFVFSNPLDIFGDPIEITPKIELIKIETICLEYKNMTRYNTVHRMDGYHKNGSENWITEYPAYYVMLCSHEERFIINDIDKLSLKDNQINCKDNTDTIVCDSKLDGNGDGICQPGESCLKFNKSIKRYSPIGYLSKDYTKSISINLKELSTR